MRFHMFLFLAGMLFVLPESAGAHHSSAAFFDADRTIEVNGVVKDWRFANPHPVLRVEATDENGQKVEWRLEFSPGTATSLARRGYSTQTFSAGEVVTAMGHPSRAPGARLLEVRTITRADGAPVP